VARERDPVANQRVTAGDVGPVDVARHGEDRNASGRPAGGIERAAARGRFNHDHAVGQCRNHAVALQELRRKCVVLRRERRKYCAAGGEHALRERAVAPRKEFVVSTAEHADRGRTGVERAFVRRGIDA